MTNINNQAIADLVERVDELVETTNIKKKDLFEKSDQVSEMHSEILDIVGGSPTAFLDNVNRAEAAAQRAQAAESTVADKGMRSFGSLNEMKSSTYLSVANTPIGSALFVSGLPDMSRVGTDEGIFKVNGLDILPKYDFNIVAFGAVEGGSFNCSTAFNAAITRANATYMATGQRQLVTVPSGVWRCSNVIQIKSGVDIKNQGTLLWTGTNAWGHFLSFGRNTKQFSFVGGIVDCNNVGNTNGIAMGGNTESNYDFGAQDFYIQTTVINCVHEPTAGEFAGGGKAVTLQHGVSDGIIDVIAINGSFGISTEGISETIIGKGRYAKNVKVRMVCKNMTEAGWLGWGSSNGGAQGTNTFMRNQGLDLDLTLINCGAGNVERAPIILNVCTNTKARVRIHNEIGKTHALIKGNAWGSELDIHAYVNQIGSLIDTVVPSGGSLFNNTATIGCRINIDGISENAATESVIRGSSPAIIRGSTINIGWIERPNVGQSALQFTAPPSGVISDTTDVEIINRSGGTGSKTYNARLFDDGNTSLATNRAARVKLRSTRGAALISIFPLSVKPLLIGWDLAGVGAGPRLWVEAINTIAAPTFPVNVFQAETAQALNGTSGPSSALNISIFDDHLYIESRITGTIGFSVRPLPVQMEAEIIAP